MIYETLDQRITEAMLEEKVLSEKLKTNFWKGVKTEMVNGDSPHVVFHKGYSNGDEYNALDIDLTVPLEKQIQNKLVETETAIQKELARKEQKEYETYLRLKKKFE